MPPTLWRRLGLADAVVLGLGAMLGAGVFTVFAPAAAAAGNWLLAAVLLAAVVAACNASSSADLAAAHPESGGGYVYGRERVAPWVGRLAGVAFLCGKTASAAAAGGVFGAYVLPGYPLLATLGVIVAVTGLNVAGVRWTARGTWVLVSALIAVLLMVVVVGMSQPGGVPDPAATISSGWPDGGQRASLAGMPIEFGGPLGVLTAAGLVFFAFAGYARIATLGEEVLDPSRTIRRAIPLALGIVLVIYLAVCAALLVGLGAARLAEEPAPLVALVDSGVSSGMDPALGAIVRLGAAAATVSVLLSVLVGVSRTGLAMARRGELPTALAAIGTSGTPWRADLAGAGLAVVIAVLAGPVAAIALSACCVLVYYAVVNVAALRMDRAERWWPKWTAWLGLVLCLGLAVLLPVSSVLITAAALAVGMLVTTVLGRRRRTGER